MIENPNEKRGSEQQRSCHCHHHCYLTFHWTFIKALLDATYLIRVAHTVSYIISPKIAHDYLPLTGQENGRDLSCIPCRGWQREETSTSSKVQPQSLQGKKQTLRAFRLLFRLSDFLFFLKNKSVHVKVWMFQKGKEKRNMTFRKNIRSLIPQWIWEDPMMTFKPCLVLPSWDDSVRLEKTSRKSPSQFTESPTSTPPSCGPDSLKVSCIELERISCLWVVEWRRWSWVCMCRDC